MDKIYESFFLVKGYYVKNAKVIIFYVFEVIISEYMEVIVFEIFRLV